MKNTQNVLLVIDFFINCYCCRKKCDALRVSVIARSMLLMCDSFICKLCQYVPIIMIMQCVYSCTANSAM